MKIRYTRVARIEKDTALQTRRLPRVLVQDIIDTSATVGMDLLRLCGVRTGGLKEICRVVDVSCAKLFHYLTSNGQQQGLARGNA